MPQNLSKLPFWIGSVPLQAIAMSERLVRYCSPTNLATAQTQANSWTSSYRRGATTAQKVGYKAFWVKEHDGTTTLILPRIAGKGVKYAAASGPNPESASQEPLGLACTLQSYLKKQERLMDPAADPGSPPFIGFNLQSFINRPELDDAGWAAIIADPGADGQDVRLRLAVAVVERLSVLSLGSVSFDVDERIDAADFAAQQKRGTYYIRLFAGAEGDCYFELNVSKLASSVDLFVQSLQDANTRELRNVLNCQIAIDLANGCTMQFSMSASVTTVDSFTAGIYGALGITGGLNPNTPTYVRVPPVKGAALGIDRFVFGLHDSVSAMGVLTSAPQTAKWILFSRVRDDMITLLQGERPNMDAPSKATVTAAINAIGAMKPSATFNAMVHQTAVGPYDIYDAAQIQAALDDGASLGEIDATVVGGKTLGEWRTICSAAPATRMMSWFDVTTANVSRDIKVVPKEDAPYYVATDTYGAAIVSGEFYAFSTLEADAAVAAINEVHAGAFASSAALKAAVAAAKNITLVANSPAVRMHAMASKAINPWEDMPGAWFKHVTNRSWQPIANALMATCSEATDMFEEVV